MGLKEKCLKMQEINWNISLGLTTLHVWENISKKASYPKLDVFIGIEIFIS